MGGILLGFLAAIIFPIAIIYRIYKSIKDWKASKRHDYELHLEWEQNGIADSEEGSERKELCVAGYIKYKKKLEPKWIATKEEIEAIRKLKKIEREYKIPDYSSYNKPDNIYWMGNDVYKNGYHVGKKDSAGRKLDTSGNPYYGSEW